MPFWSNLFSIRRAAAAEAIPQPAERRPEVVSAPPIAPPLSALDRDVLIRTLFGEARSEPVSGQAAVVHVIRNRVLARKTSAAVECKRPWQFSCWLPSDPNLAKMLALAVTDPRYIALGKVADAAWLAPDSVAGARHYFALAGMVGGKPPAWAKPPGYEVARIGGHRFWANVA